MEERKKKVKSSRNLNQAFKIEDGEHYRNLVDYFPLQNGGGEIISVENRTLQCASILPSGRPSLDDKTEALVIKIIHQNQPRVANTDPGALAGSESISGYKKNP